MDKIDISVVIVNYNVKDFLLQCLRSIERSSKGLNVETIVVDNNSQDGSVEFLEPLYPDVKFIALKENRGFGIANNIGFKEARGKYILILNPDTILEEKTLSHMYDYMENHPEVGIAGCKVLNPDGTFQLACRRGFPSPWASFCKLFGLQSLFPKSKLFAQYNQTFRDVDETYYIDVLGGSFMFTRREVIEKTGGFDEDYFMYGEDIDLCHASTLHGWKNAYVHTTTIIHYKGESTRRSSINEIHHFYEAMEIFASKHFSHSGLFLFFLKLGIMLRSILAYASRNKRQIFVILTDLITLNAAFLISTKLRFGGYFALHDYAYPTVFIAINLAVFGSMVAVGEYFEDRPAIRKAVFGYMIAFFILSSLTYYFKDFAFSRGIVLSTIGASVLMALITRTLLTIYDNHSGSEARKKILLVGINGKSENIIRRLQEHDAVKAEIAGLVAVGKDAGRTKFPVLGNIEYLPKIIEDNKVQEVIITDNSINGNKLMKLVTNKTSNPVRYHIAQEFEDVLAARIINEISGLQPTVPRYSITKLRYRIAKRIIDILISIILLTIGLPFIYIFNSKPGRALKNLTKSLSGNMSVIGLYGEKKYNAGKPGIIGLAHLSGPATLSKEAIDKLNNFYIQNYNLSLDLDIFFKFIFRKKSGN